MWGAIIAAVAGAVGGGVVQGVVAAKQNKELVKAYKNAAKTMQEATDKYSGKNLYEGMRTAGDDMAYKAGRNAEQAFTNTNNPGQVNNGMAKAIAEANIAADSANSAANSGRALGQSIEKSRKDALYNRDTIAAQQALKQAGIDYNVKNQGMQEAMNAAGGLAQLGGNLAAGVNSNK